MHKKGVIDRNQGKVIEMNVLVTGATGRIGGNLVSSLRERDYKVRCFIFEGDSNIDRLKKFRVEIVYGDLRSYESCVRAVRDIDAVVHLGAYLPNPLNVEFYQRTPMEKNQILFDVNIKGVFNLLEATAQQCKDCQRFIFASTTATYPTGYVKERIDEEYPQKPDSMYGISKKIGEELVRGYGRTKDLPFTIFRFATVIGAGEILDKVYYPLFSAVHWINVLGEMRKKDDEVISAIKNLEEKIEDEETLLIPYGRDGCPMEHQLVDVRDVVRGLILGLEKDSSVGEAFNLAESNPFSYEEVVPYVSKKLDLSYIKAQLPVTTRHYNISIEKARSILGYVPRYNVFRMIDSAIDFRNGKESDLVERGKPRV